MKIFIIFKKILTFFWKGFFCLFFLGLNSCDSESKIISNLHKGQTYLFQSNLDSAQFFFDEAFKLDSNNLKVIDNLAELHFRKVEIGKALNYFNKSILIDSTNELTYLKIAEIKLFLGDYNSVFENVNKGLRINPMKHQAYFIKGTAYKYIGDTTKAISSFRTALELKNDFSEVYYELGLLLTLQNDPIAIEYYKRGLDLAPEDAGLKSSLAWCYDKFNKYSKANNAYYNIVSESNSYTNAKFNFAVFKYRMNQTDTALLLCNEVLDFDSLHFSCLNLKGIILKKQGKTRESREVKNKLLIIKSQLDK